LAKIQDDCDHLTDICDTVTDGHWTTLSAHVMYIDKLSLASQAHTQVQ